MKGSRFEKLPNDEPSITHFEQQRRVDRHDVLRVPNGCSLAGGIALAEDKMAERGRIRVNASLNGQRGFAAKALHVTVVSKRKDSEVPAVRVEKAKQSVCGVPIGDVPTRWDVRARVVNGLGKHLACVT